jgi:putative transposase
VNASGDATLDQLVSSCPIASQLLPFEVLRQPLEFTQYASGDYQACLAAHGLVGSMSRRGNCWDNAVAESFFSTLKIELVYTTDWATRADARAAVFEYLEVFYNGQRRHSSLGYLSPVAFEQRHEEKALAA